MRKVLIIDDNDDDFKSIKEKFSKANWEVIPDNAEFLNALYSESQKDGLLNEIEMFITDNYKEIGIIILDINLFGGSVNDKFGLEAVLERIRKMKFTDISYWAAQVPIIAYTKWGNDPSIKQMALGNQYHVHSFIGKGWSEDHPEELLLTAEALYAIFAMNVNYGGFENYFEDYFSRMKKFRVAKQGAIEVKLDDMNILFEGSYNDIKNFIDIILKSTLRGLSDQNQEALFEELIFRAEKVLDNNQHSKFNSEFRKDEVKMRLKECLRNCNFSKFVTNLLSMIDALDDIGLINSLSEEWIIGTSFTAIVNILSK
jgi:CheY-like chemotaxis protein